MYFLCTGCKKEITSPSKPVWLCNCGNPLEVHYSWENKIHTIDVDDSKSSLWRYNAVLPNVKQTITLGEGHTPLIPIGENILLKDETVNPTGSFKDRGMALAVTMAKAQGVQNICLPSAGNAGISAAAYCKKAEISCYVYLPETIPEPFKKETEKYGAEIILSGETISDAAKQMLNEKKEGWFDISTLKEPFRVEGKKTLGYEIAEQLGWEFPDVIIYETGGGTGLIGMWKAFLELKGLGWVKGKLPKMVAAQSDGCAPVVKAFQNLDNKTEFWENSNTIALGLNVPDPLGGSWILDILYKSNGIAIPVSENELSDLTEELNGLANLNASAEAGVVWGAYNTLLNMNWINQNQKVVLFATGVERCKFK
ncbi:MAG: threonine synthase [Candidatus Marinimicrobia bacterium]|nr:threonine synthase [Candidatus Neomarinimicrobiota bacterium]